MDNKWDHFVIFFHLIDLLVNLSLSAVVIFVHHGGPLSGTVLTISASADRCLTLRVISSTIHKRKDIRQKSTILREGIQIMLQRRNIIVCFLLLAGLVSLAFAQQVDTSLVDIDQKIGLWMKEWHIPGMAVGVVKDEKILLYKGYGLRDVGKKLPITPKTVFSIASDSLILCK